MAPGAGSKSASDIGMIAVIEANTRSAGATAKLQELARANVRSVRNRTYPVLAALCAWRTELVLDGLTPEDLREQLVEGMNRIRRVNREGKQQKELKLEVEP
jgi:hypothetical protein